MKSRLLMALSLAGAPPALADVIPCPDAAQAVQVAACPSEEELRHTYSGFCSDDRRLYARDTDTCASYENYRRKKNVALWESADGRFQAYLSCDLPDGALRRLKPTAIAVSRQGGISRIACSYGEHILFAHRTRRQCKVEGSGNCGDDPSACKAACD